MKNKKRLLENTIHGIFLILGLITVGCVLLITAVAVLLASLMIVMGCLYDYFEGVQEEQLKDELSLAAAAVEDSGQEYLEKLKSEN